MNQDIRRTMTAEAIGSFTPVFAGTVAIVVNGTSGGTVVHVVIAVTFALIVLAKVCAVGDVLLPIRET